MKKKNFHLGTADFIISAFILAVIIILFNVFMLPDSNIDFLIEKDIKLVVSMSEVDKNDAALINDNDVVFNCDDSSKIGTVKSISSDKPSSSFEIDKENGEKIYHYYPDLVNKSFTIECKAIERDGRFFINDKEYAVSDVFDFYVKDYSGKCKIESIEVME